MHHCPLINRYARPLCTCKTCIRTCDLWDVAMWENRHVGASHKHPRNTCCRPRPCLLLSVATFFFRGQRLWGSLPKILAPKLKLYRSAVQWTEKPINWSWSEVRMGLPPRPMPNSTWLRTEDGNSYKLPLEILSSPTFGHLLLLYEYSRVSGQREEWC
jgi:hypothetical protein